MSKVFHWTRSFFLLAASPLSLPPSLPPTTRLRPLVVLGLCPAAFRPVTASHARPGTLSEAHNRPPAPSPRPIRPHRGAMSCAKRGKLPCITGQLHLAVDRSSRSGLTDRSVLPTGRRLKGMQPERSDFKARPEQWASTKTIGRV